MRNKQTTLGVIASVAMAVAFFSFFTPFVSVEMWYSYCSTGFELIEQAEGGAELLLFAIIGTLLGIVTALACAYSNFSFSVPMIASIGSVVCVMIYFSEGMDYVTNGFWMFVLSHVVSAMLCGYAMLSSNNSGANSYQGAQQPPVTRTQQVIRAEHNIPPMTNPVGANRFCPECGARVKPDSKFCVNCGTSQNIDPAPQTSAQQQPVPEPWICNACGMENKPHVQTCQGCGVTKDWSDAQK